MARILIVDDDPNIQLLFEDLIWNMGHAYASARNLSDGLFVAKKDNHDLILLDLDFPEGNGIDILPELIRLPGSPEVIVITGTDNARGVEVAFKYGAWDYLKKPFLIEEISLHITRALEYKMGKTHRDTATMLKREDIVGESEAILVCLEETAKAASTDSSVLITGESGTGKELFARAIHQNSKRSANAFVAVDCGALPDTLVESILFGHEKGAFTGADHRREGLISQAEGGTIFFDEIGELNPNIQKKLLRTLQEHRLRPVGGRNECAVNFRLVAATNRNLEEMVNENKFREDLLFRIGCIELKLPPLRQRTEDIPLILGNKLQQIGAGLDLEAKRISAEFIDILQRYDWPGNVRELINILEHSIANAGQDPILVPKHLPSKYRTILFEQENADLSGDNAVSAANGGVGSDGQLAKWIDYRFQAEKSYLQSLISRCNGSWENACLLSGFGKSRLYELLRKHNLSFEKPIGPTPRT